MEKRKENARNILMADCSSSELNRFVEGISSISNLDYTVKVKISNLDRKSKIREIKRYISYFSLPFKEFINRKKYNIVIGWQQFHALNFAFFCKIFHVKKVNTVIAMNFTYKRKKGLIGKIYYKYMKSIMQSKYIDKVHVPSKDYIDICSHELGCDKNKFFYAPFGKDDIYEKYKNISNPIDYNYCMSIGRSNRDFKFLIENFPENKNLIIISDTYKYDKNLPENIRIVDNVSGEEQYKYFMNADIIICPILDGSIPSGDTTILNSFCLKKVVVITEPSALAQTYIKNGINGFSLKKDSKFKKKLEEIIDNSEKLKVVALNARKDFENNYSRFNLGKELGKVIVKIKKK